MIERPTSESECCEDLTKKLAMFLGPVISFASADAAAAEDEPDEEEERANLVTSLIKSAATFLFLYLFSHNSAISETTPVKCSFAYTSSMSDVTTEM